MKRSAELLAQLRLFLSVKGRFCMSPPWMRHCVIAVALLMNSEAKADDTTAESDEESTAVIFAQWQTTDYSQANVRAILRYWMMRHRPMEGAPRRDQILKLMNEGLLPLLNEADAAGRMVAETEVFVAQGNWTSGWAQIRLIQDSEGIRNDQSKLDRFGNPVAESSQVHIQSNGEDIDFYNQALRQASVRPLPSRFAIHRLADFSFIPKFNETLMKEAQIVTIDGSRKKLSVRNMTVEYSGESGFVHSLTLTDPSGTILEERLQSPSENPPSGNTIPKFSAILKYHRTSENSDLRLYLAQVYIVDEIELDPELPEDRFVLSIPAKSRIAKFDSDGSLISVIRTPKPTENVSKVAESLSKTDLLPSRINHPPAPLEARRRIIPLLLANGILIACLLILAFTRWRRRVRNQK